MIANRMISRIAIKHLRIKAALKRQAALAQAVELLRGEKRALQPQG